MNKYLKKSSFLLSFLLILSFYSSANTKILQHTSFIAHGALGYSYRHGIMSSTYPNDTPNYDSIPDIFSNDRFQKDFYNFIKTQVSFDIINETTGYVCAEVFLQRDNRMHSGIAFATTYPKPGCTEIFHMRIKNTTQGSETIATPVYLGDYDHFSIAGDIDWHPSDSIELILKPHNIGDTKKNLVPPVQKVKPNSLEPFCSASSSKPVISEKTTQKNQLNTDSAQTSTTSKAKTKAQAQPKSKAQFKPKAQPKPKAHPKPKQTQTPQRPSVNIAPVIPRQPAQPTSEEIIESSSSHIKVHSWGGLGRRYLHQELYSPKETLLNSKDWTDGKTNKKEKGKKIIYNLVKK